MSSNKIKERLEQLAPSSELPTTTNDYSDVELTPDETAELLRAGREAKYHENRRREWMEQVKRTPVYKQYTAKDLWIALTATQSATGSKYKIDDDNRQQVISLCQYFSNDSRFTGDLKKGLMLMGKNGTGKSHLMAFFMQNQNLSYSVVSARAVENQWINETKEEVGNAIGKYSAMLPIALNTNMFGHTEIGFCFDDIGSESVPSKKYGEEKNVLAEVLLNRYDNKLPFNATHITTNLGAADFEKIYGTRMRDRFREMFNVITFKGDSRRA